MERGLLDMDGVLVDFIRGAHEIHNVTENVYLRPESQNCWDVVKLFGMSEPAFWKPMDEEFWAKLEWTPDGREILALVEKRFGDNVCLLTTPSMNYGCMAGKMRWIERHIPQYKRRFLMGPRKEFCAGPDRVLIDDSDANVQMFTKHGGHAVLIPRRWNSHHEMMHESVKYLEMRLFS